MMTACKFYVFLMISNNIYTVQTLFSTTSFAGLLTFIFASEVLYYMMNACKLFVFIMISSCIYS